MCCGRDSKPILCVKCGSFCVATREYIRCRKCGLIVKNTPEVNNGKVSSLSD